MKKRSIRPLWIIGGFVLLSLACQLASESASVPGVKLRSGGQIAFISDRSGEKLISTFEMADGTNRSLYESISEIYLMNPDGSGLRQLTDNELTEMLPSWSPDSGEVAFTAWPIDSVFDEDSNIYIMGRDGSNVRQVTHRSFTALQPRWSPDGKQIIFLSDDPGETDIYLLNLQNNKTTKLSQDPLGGDMHSLPWEFSPAVWSPDGEWIAYASPNPNDEYWDLYKVSASSKKTIRLTHTAAYEVEPTWSPDGKKIAFIRYLPEGCEEGCNIEIFVMNSDGSQEKQLTEDAGMDANPVWSPDGKHIAFISSRDGNVEIYLMNEDGSGLKRLTDDPADDYDTVWSPDGKQLIFVSERDGNQEIYCINLDGSGLVNLTNEGSDDYNPSWSPGD